jgi:hypothetical protein
MTSFMDKASAAHHKAATCVPHRCTVAEIQCDVEMAERNDLADKLAGKRAQADALWERVKVLQTDAENHGHVLEELQTTMVAKREMIARLQHDWSARAAKCSTKMFGGSTQGPRPTRLPGGLADAMSTTLKGVRAPHLSLLTATTFSSD